MLALLASLAVPVRAAEDATGAAIRLSKTEGTVEVSKGSGKKLTLLEKMRLYSGYHVKTEEESYAWINLDNTKLLKEDAKSEVEVRKSGKKLEVNLSSGNLFFNVAEALENDETLNVSTSTMVVGVRGTSGWVQTEDRWKTMIYLLEGTLLCVVSDTVTSQLKTAELHGGDVAECVVYPQDKAGDKCDIILRTFTVEDIPGFVLTELTHDMPLCDKIAEKTGMDIPREITKTAGGRPDGRMPGGKTATPEVLGEAEKRQDRDEDELGKELDEIEEARKKQDKGTKPKPTDWPGGTTPPKDTSGGGGTSRPWDDDDDSSSSSSEPQGPRTMKLKDVEVEALLRGTSSLQVLANTNSADRTPKKNILEVDTGLTVAAGKTLNLQSGIDVEVYAGKTLRVDGTMAMSGNLTNRGAVTVTSGDTLRVRGNLSTSGTVTVPATGRIVVDGTFTRSGGTLALTRGAAVLAKTFAPGAAPSGWKVSAAADSNGYYTLVPADARTYTITFDANGGQLSDGALEIQVVTALDGTIHAGAMPTVTRSGYTFAGWFTAASGGTQIPAGHVFTADGTVYAQWTAGAGYTVTFDAGSGTFADGSSEMTLTTGPDGRLTEALPVPTVPGFVFEGWYTDYTGGTKVEAGYVFTGNTRLYSEWSVVYTVTIYPGDGTWLDGTSAPIVRTTDANGKIQDVDQPIRGDDCLFMSWVGGDLGWMVIDLSTVEFERDTEVYPLWGTSVILIGNSGTIDGKEQGVAHAYQEEVSGAFKIEGLDSNVPVRSGYTFDGWFTEQTGGVQMSDGDEVSGPVTLYAHWTAAATYTVTFNPNGGTCSVTSAATGTDGKLTGALPTAIQVNYTFDGWYTAATGGTQIDFSTTEFKADTTVYAHWTAAATYTVTFNPNGGTCSVTSAATGTDGKLTGALPTAIQVNYTFDGWYTAATGGTQIDFSTTEFKADTTVYAHWTAETYTVTFNPNGGNWSGSTASQTATTDGSFHATAPAAPTLANYTFDGWFTAATGGTQVNFTTEEFKADTTLYAQWKPVAYTVTFNGNGGNWSGALTQEVTTTDDTWIIAEPGAPARANSPNTNMPYQFDGWFTEPVGGTAVDVSQPFKQDTTVFAHWTLLGVDYEINGKTLHFYGSGSMPDTAYGSTAPWADAAAAAGVTSVVIDEGILNVGNYAFSDISTLTSASIPGSVKTIGDSAFEGCTGLNSLALPEGVTSIGSSAFSSCSNLTGVTLPSTLGVIRAVLRNSNKGANMVK